MRFLLVGAILFATLNTYSQECELAVTGHVEDSDTREKLAGATVTITGVNRQVVTDDQGDFIFPGLCNGTYTLFISHIGCDPVTRTIIINRNRHLDILLPHRKSILEAVTIEAPRSIVNTGIRRELSGKELEATRGLGLAESLTRITGVNLLQTGSTISKPIFHGLHSSRLLTINNGVRQEGQQWGNEHAPEVDPFLADKLVIVKGVDELRYGSDAIGGVILVEPRPLRYVKGLAGEFNTVYFSNNRQFVNSAMLEHQLKNLPALSYRLQGTIKRAANVNTPGYRLNNTASREENFSINVGWKKPNYTLETFYSLFQTRLGIFSGSHIGNITDLANAIANPRPAQEFTGESTYEISRPNQDVTHHLAKVRSGISSGKHKFNVQIAAQFNERLEYDLTRNSSNTTPQLNLSIFTLSEDFSWDHPSYKNISGTVGVSIMQQENSYAGRYFIPNYSARSYGAYWIEKYSKHKWQLQAGIRFDNKQIDTRRLLFNGQEMNYDFNFSTVATSFNAIYNAAPGLQLNTSFSLSSRAPQVNELLSNGIHHGTATYERGNLNLKPERSINLSGGINYQSSDERFYIDGIVYQNTIDRFIYQQPKPGEPVLTIAGAFPLIQTEQTDAVLKGADLSIGFRPLNSLLVSGKASLLRARNKMANDWLILMPSDRVSGNLTYSIPAVRRISNSSLSLELQHSFEQTRVPSERLGVQDYKVPPPAYTLINASASTTIQIGKIPVTVAAGVRNLFNTSYREYLNSFRYFTDEMGRNINLRIKIPLNLSSSNL